MAGVVRRCITSDGTKNWPSPYDEGQLPVDDLGTPSPRKGSICCEKEIDRFSICYGDDASIQASRKQ